MRAHARACVCVCVCVCVCLDSMDAEVMVLRNRQFLVYMIISL